MDEDGTVRIPIAPGLDADVIVVGAGPAGAAVAAHLARDGWSVLLLDRQRFPRDKVCGDFVGPVALLELQALGIDTEADYRATNSIWSAALYADGKELIARPIPALDRLPAYGRCIPRFILDEWVLASARRAGAAVVEGYTAVRYDIAPDAASLVVKTEEGERLLHAHLIIGADGSSSAIGRQLRGAAPADRTRIIAARAYYEDYAGPSDRADLYFTGESFPGYYWLFPTGKRTANVGVGMVLETYPPKTEHLRDMMLRLVEQDPALRSRLAPAKMVGKIVGWPLSTYDPSAPLVDERVLLIGDAAGFINPLNGEGIQYALLSARWAADCASAALQSANFSRQALQPYATRAEHELRFDMAFAGMIVECIRNRHLNGVWLKLLGAIAARARVDPRYAEVCGAVLAGIVPSNRALSARVIGRTIDQVVYSAVLATAWSVIRGPRNLLNDASSAVLGVGSTTAAMARDPMALLNWLVQVARQGGELAIEAVLDGIHLRAPHAPRLSGVQPQVIRLGG